MIQKLECTDSYRNKQNRRERRKPVSGDYFHPNAMLCVRPFLFPLQPLGSPPGRGTTRSGSAITLDVIT